MRLTHMCRQLFNARSFLTATTTRAEREAAYTRGGFSVALARWLAAGSHGSLSGQRERARERTGVPRKAGRGQGRVREGAGPKSWRAFHRGGIFEAAVLPAQSGRFKSGLSPRRSSHFRLRVSLSPSLGQVQK